MPQRHLHPDRPLHALPLLLLTLLAAGCASTGAPPAPGPVGENTPEPVWYREVPNWPGVRLFGAGGATVPSHDQAADAREQAHSAALAQLKGRARQLLERTLRRFPADAVAGGDTTAFINAVLDPQEPRPVDAVEGPQAAGLWSAWELLSLDIDALIGRIDQQQRQWWLSAPGTPEQAASGLPLEALFVALRLEQTNAWGRAALHEASQATPEPPEWFRNLPRDTAGSVFGAGQASASDGTAPSRLEELALVAARAHVRDTVRFTLDLSLHKLINVPAGCEPEARERFCTSVTALVAATLASRAELVARELHDGSANPSARPALVSMHVLVRVAPAQIARVLSDVINDTRARQLEPPTGVGRGSRLLPDTCRAFWTATWRALWLSDRTPDDRGN